jgi:hypothetical protein
MLDLNAVQRYCRRMTNPFTTAELQRILVRWDDRGGVTAAVLAFAQAVPVADRTVWYWLGGRAIHPAMAERIRSMEPPNKTASMLALKLCQRCGRDKNSRFHLRECGWPD